MDLAMDSIKYCFVLLVFSAVDVECQNGEWGVTMGGRSAPLTPEPVEDADVLIWCTVSLPEQYKCGNLSRATLTDKALFGKHYIPLTCKQASSAEECMAWTDDGAATLLTVDAGEVAEASRRHSLVPILQTVHEGSVAFEYSVALVKRGDAAGGLRGLRGARACFPRVGSAAGWLLPVHTLMKSGGLEVVDCNNHVRSVSAFFGDSCAPDALSDTYNPLGENPASLCALCGEAGRGCGGAGPRAGHAGALRCLLQTSARVAFLRHTSLLAALRRPHLYKGLSNNTVELMCEDGTTQPVSEWRRCNWGRSPADVFVTSSARSLHQRTRYQNFIMKLVELYGAETGEPGAEAERPSVEERFGAHQHTSNRIDGLSSEAPRFEQFRLQDSLRYGSFDLLFQDELANVHALPEEQQSARAVLGDGAAERAAAALRACPVSRAALCVTSTPEMDKCMRMKIALKAAQLSPGLTCVRAHSTRDCERAVAAREADLVTLDAADMLHAAAHHALVPFMQEVYAGGRADYYAVAVASQQDPDTDLTYLKNKKTCHAGISTAAGWLYPLAYLISNGWIRSYGCDGARAASEYFSKSCAPGALSAEYVDPAHGAPRDNLCQLCHGSSFRRCRRDASEDYYGHVGAVQCMVEGGGDVAFVRHTAPLEVAGGRSKEWWARNLLPDDLQLLCPDGTRASVHDYVSCNLGRVPGSVLVGRANHTELNAYADLLLYAQQLFGALTADDFSFSMFYSPPPYSDLLFSSAAVSLRRLEHAHRSAAWVAGTTLPRAARLVACDAPAAAALAADPAFLSASAPPSLSLSLSFSLLALTPLLL